MDTEQQFSVFSCRRFWLVIILAFILRAVWAVLIPIDRVSDERAYHLLANQLATGGVYGFDGTPYAYWPVGYPFFLSLQYRLFGQSAWLVPAVSVWLSTVVVALTIILTLQWFADKRVALVAGLVIALYPVHIQFTSIVSSEILFTLLLLCGVVAWGRRSHFSILRALFAGLLLGLASYVRPVALVVPAALVLARLFDRPNFKTLTLEIIVVGFTMAVVVAPWTYRNYRTYGRFVPISTNGGMCLFFGNNPLAPNQYQSIINPKDFVGSDADRDAYCSAQAKAFIAAHPWDFVKRSVRKALRLWERDTIGVAWNSKSIEGRFGSRGVTILKAVSQVYWVLLSFLIVCSFVLLPMRFGWQLLVTQPGIWISLEFTALHAVMYSQDRYHFPLVPLLVPLVGAMVVTWFTKPMTMKMGL